MKRIVISPTGVRRYFDYDDLIHFQSWLYAVLSGVPKRVTVGHDEDFNEVYTVSYD